MYSRKFLYAALTVILLVNPIPLWARVQKNVNGVTGNGSRPSPGSLLSHELQSLPSQRGDLVGVDPGIGAPDRPDQTIILKYDFREGTLGWEAGFADYSLDNEGLMLEAGLRELPPELGVEGTGFYIQGKNVSDDLFMFLKRHLGPEDGVRPNQPYLVVFRFSFASDAPSNCAGVGGAPGESVYLKAGASPTEPRPVLLEPERFYMMNVDKGNQAIGGPAASVVGTIANGIPCEEALQYERPPYVILDRIHRHEYVVTSSEDGEIWLLMGTDSAFEGLTALYYQQIEVLLVPTTSN